MVGGEGWRRSRTARAGISRESERAEMQRRKAASRSQANASGRGPFGSLRVRDLTALCASDRIGSVQKAAGGKGRMAMAGRSLAVGNWR